jgi:separase
LKIDLAARAIDSICILAKYKHSRSKLDTHTTVYGYLHRGVILVNAYKSSLSNNRVDTDTSDTIARVLRCLSGAFWNHAIALYQDDKYAAAVRFLVHACDLGTRACSVANELGVSDSNPGTGPTSDSWGSFKTSLPKRWELLGDCYIKIGDRQASSTHMSHLPLLLSDNRMKA